MKKSIILALALIILFSMSACSSKKDSPTYGKVVQNNINNTGNYTTNIEINNVLTTDELNAIVSELNKAEDYSDKIASILIRNWSTESYFSYFYDEYRFKNSGFKDDEDYANVHKYREQAEQILNDTKKQLAADLDTDFYAAVKDYYLSVSNYLALLSEFPAGYSKLTYATAITDCQNECRTNLTNVDFYLD